MYRCSSAAEFVSGRVRTEESAHEEGDGSEKTASSAGSIRRQRHQCNTAFSRAQGGARRCCCQPLPEEMLCRSRCIVSRAQHSEMVSYGVGRDRCRNTSGVGDGRGSSLHKHAEQMVCVQRLWSSEVSSSGGEHVRRR